MAHPRNRKFSDPAAVVAYVRVSTEEQANERGSLDAQEARIRAYCAMHGLELIEVLPIAGKRVIPVKLFGEEAGTHAGWA